MASRLALLAPVCFSSLFGCFSAGDGTAPPGNSFYFPVGLAVSRAGNVLYTANSDFDLQWNGGTLQSYDLSLIRRHTLIAIKDPSDPNGLLPLLRRGVDANACPANPPVYSVGGGRQPLGETCSPPVDSTVYVRDSATVGAFATDLLLSRSGTRIYVPVRGDASLTWVDVAYDDPAAPAPFTLDCGTRVDNRCDDAHRAGAWSSEPGNTRGLTLPGEPFGLSESEDGSALVITHQTDTKTSLFSTGLATGASPTAPALQYVLDGMARGGMGITAVPHDPLAFPDCGSTPFALCPPRPAFVQVSRVNAQIELLRLYSDEGYLGPSSLRRPFLVRETTFPITANAGGSDSRSVAIDSTPRLACKAQVAAADPTSTPPRTPAMVTADQAACARLPARIFIANRTPASLLVGEVGATTDTVYDADRIVISKSVPLTFGPSRVYLAPVVDSTGRYALRVFVVCFDSSIIFIYDPSTDSIENLVRVGQGPFAMAFDPYDLNDVAVRAVVPVDDRVPVDPVFNPSTDRLRRYRFGYVASFTKSFVQSLDLDNARPDKSTFERVVYTLGLPTAPKGSR
jgi:hypothetical protein